MNKVILQGNTGGDIDIHYFQDGGCVGKVSLATTKTYKNKQGEKVQDTQWHNLIFRNKSAEAISKWAAKGSSLLIEGEIKYRDYEHEGQKRYVTEIIVLGFNFLKTVKPGENGTAEHTGKDPGDDLSPEHYDDLPF